MNSDVKPGISDFTLEYGNCISIEQRFSATKPSIMSFKEFSRIMNDSLTAASYNGEIMNVFEKFLLISALS